MFPFTQQLFHLLATITILAHPHIAIIPTATITPTSTPTFTPTTTPKQELLKATGNIKRFGKTAHLTAVFPKNGGTVTGDISGDCTGKIKGTYSGDDNGRQLQGTASATCQVFFFTVNGSADFIGSVNDTDTHSDITYTVKVNNHSESGTFSFNISPNN